MSKEAMKLALDALKQERENYRLYGDEDGSPEYIHEAIKALEAALAKQEQDEPFGWYDMEHGEIRDVEWNRQKPTYEGVWRPLYTTPQQRKPLTDEDKEILEAVRRELDEGNGNAPGHGHRVVGIWDEDNGDKAGKPCAWCLTWAKFTKLIENEAAHGIKE